MIDEQEDTAASVTLPLCSFTAFSLSDIKDSSSDITMSDMEVEFSPPLPSPKHGLLLLRYFWKEVGYEMGLTHFSLYLLF